MNVRSKVEETCKDYKNTERRPNRNDQFRGHYLSIMYGNMEVNVLGIEV